MLFTAWLAETAAGFHPQLRALCIAAGWRCLGNPEIPHPRISAFPQCRWPSALIYGHWLAISCKLIGRELGNEDGRQKKPAWRWL